MMSIGHAIIKELRHEAANTTRMLERLPADRFDFKPHEKSSSLGKLATHIADLPAWIPLVLNEASFNLVNRPFVHGPVTTTEDLVKLHADHVAAAINALETTSDELLAADWVLSMGDHVIVKMPRVAVIRSLGLSHMIHHRGQLSVYMRLNNIPVPGIYGPSADEQ